MIASAASMCVRALCVLVSTPLAILLSACSAPPPAVAPGAVAAEEQRLLRPFQDQRVVIADQVEVTVSPNFLGSRVDQAGIDNLLTASDMGGLSGNRVALPGIDKELHERRSSPDGDGSVVTYVNKDGGLERPLRLLVGATQFQALQTVTVRTLGSGARMTLDVVARGDVNVLAGKERHDVPQLEIRDGLWRGQ
jgi:hypothetical protein